MISSGYDDYVSGPRFADALPQGTDWVRYPHTDLRAGNPLLEVLGPATLRTLPAHRTSWRGGVVKETRADRCLFQVAAAALSQPVITVA